MGNYAVSEIQILKPWSTTFLPSGSRKQQNLIENGGFDATYKHTGFLKSWSCQGEQAKYIPMVRTLTDSKTKPYSGLCSRRTSFLQGPSIDISKLISSLKNFIEHFFNFR